MNPIGASSSVQQGESIEDILRRLQSSTQKEEIDIEIESAGSYLLSELEVPVVEMIPAPPCLKSILKIGACRDLNVRKRKTVSFCQDTVHNPEFESLKLNLRINIKNWADIYHVIEFDTEQVNKVISIFESNFQDTGEVPDTSINGVRNAVKAKARAYNLTSPDFVDIFLKNHPD